MFYFYIDPTYRIRDKFYKSAMACHKTGFPHIQSKDLLIIIIICNLKLNHNSLQNLLTSIQHKVRWTWRTWKWTRSIALRKLKDCILTRFLRTKNFHDNVSMIIIMIFSRPIRLAIIEYIVISLLLQHYHASSDSWRAYSFAIMMAFLAAICFGLVKTLGTVWMTFSCR